MSRLRVRLRDATRALATATVMSAAIGETNSRGSPQGRYKGM